MTYATREDQIDRRCEEVAVLQKERAFLREENFEALVDRDLRLVGFDLAEVGIDRRIEHEAAVQDELSVQTDVGFESAALESRMVRVALVDVAEAAKQSVGNQLNVPAGRDVLHPARIGGLVEAPLNAVGNSRPEHVFVGARDAAIQNDAPLLLVRFGEAQALEWDRDQGKVAAPGQVVLRSATPYRKKNRNR